MPISGVRSDYYDFAVTVGEASEDEISRRLKDSALAPIMQPSVVKKVEQIPVLGSGKVNLKAVKDLAIELGL